ncbi:MAG TPA: DUF4339 domain-containing protein [Tepidisphaeraceae bacterium]|jgi:hypothetical protein
MPDWFVHCNGQQQGPFPAQQVAQMIRNGAISEGDLAWREGMPQWSAVGAIPELARAIGAGGMPAVAALPPLTSISIADDPGPFRKVGSQFTINGKQWVGKSVASPQAVYLLKARRLNQGGAYGGLAGALLTAAFTGGDDDTRTCDITELPPAVRAQFDPKGKRTSGDVVIIRKAAVSYVKAPRVNAIITFTVGGEQIKVNTGAFGAGRNGRFLAENGWVLNQPQQPTEAPIHGPGFGRAPGQVQPQQGPSALRRVLYVVIAIALFVLVIVIRILARH